MPAPERIHFSANEMAQILPALQLLHARFGGRSWTLRIGEPTYSPEDFVIYRDLFVNEQAVAVEHAPDAVYSPPLTTVDPEEKPK